VADLLIVDNDARLVALLARFLERRGHEVRTATSFVEARRRLDERVPELLLSDVDLGAESGRVELERLARERRLPPTLVVSGFLDAQLVRELERLPGVLGTLAKPFDPAELERRVHELCAAAPTTPGPSGSRPAPPAAEADEEDDWVEVRPLEDDEA
jgi:two-component system phosphate regulon response regulator OmpR